MKKYLAIAAVTVSLNAFADHHHGKSMVTLSGYETGDFTDRSLDFSNSTGGSPNTSSRNIALNYAYAITDTIQIGVNYKNLLEETSGNVQGGLNGSRTTYGLQAIYNFAGKLTDTNYVALKYDMVQAKESDVGGNDDDKRNIWTVSFGHRFSLGNLWNMNFNWSPSVDLAFAKTSPADSSADDSSNTNLNVTPVKFDVIF